MNDASPQVDQFEHWREALRTGKPVAYERGAPTAGYFKVRDRNPDRSIRWDALAIWLDDEAGWLCQRTGPRRAPIDADEIEELFSGCNSTPISYELFERIVAGEPWPEDVAPVEVAAELPPHERADAELTAQRAAMAEWIKSVVSVKTKEQADKCGNFADEFAKIEKAAEETRKAEKKPHDDAAAAVQAKWQPIVKRAAELKAWAKKTSEPFLIAERDRIKAEERARADEAARIAREAAQARLEAERAGQPPPIETASPPPPPPPQKAKAGTGRGVHLRTRTIHEITDLRALLMFFADSNMRNPDLMATLQILVNRMRSAGVEVPGVETKTIEEAA